MARRTLPWASRFLSHGRTTPDRFMINARGDLEERMDATFRLLVLTLRQYPCCVLCLFVCALWAVGVFPKLDAKNAGRSFPPFVIYNPMSPDFRPRSSFAPSLCRRIVHSNCMVYYWNHFTPRAGLHDSLLSISLLLSSTPTNRLLECTVKVGLLTRHDKRTRKWRRNCSKKQTIGAS